MATAAEVGAASAPAPNNEELVRQYLRELRKETQSSTGFRDAIELLIKITRNVLPPKNSVDGGASGGVDPKFKQINPSNSDFNRKIWKFQAARKILYRSGWERNGEDENLRLIRNDDAADSKNFMSSSDLMELLVQNRIVTPSTAEWVQETKTENVLTPDEKYRQDKLRGTEERKAEYAKFQREKQAKKELAENLRKEQAADIAYRQIRQPKTDGQLNAITPQWNPYLTRQGRPQTPDDDDDEDEGEDEVEGDHEEVDEDKADDQVGVVGAVDEDELPSSSQNPNGQPR